ncbi:MAG: hypothetical protein WBP34_18790, partial [Thermoanaerobaculia bacterium]
MFVPDMKAQRASNSVERQLLVAVVLTLMALFILHPGLHAQEAEAEPEQQAAEPTEAKPPPASASNTGSVLADIMESRKVSKEALRRIYIPDELLTTANSEQHADVTFMNRRITRLRAQIMGNLPRVRVKEASERLEKQVELRRTQPVDSVYIDQGVLIRIDEKTIFAITTADLDVVAGETLDGRAEEAINNLEKAIGDAEALRRPGQILRSLGYAAVITLAFALWIWLVLRLERLSQAKLIQLTDTKLKDSLAGSIAEQSDHSTKIVKHIALLVRGIGAVLILFSTYLWLTAVLKRFPYTRPWGEALGGYLLGVVTWITGGIIDAIPGLFIVAVIFYLTRGLSRLMSASFKAIEEERLHVPGLDADTAQPTKKLATAGVWLLALVVAYPYLPGSSTDAFKGLSVFVGLVISLGSTG